MRVCLDCGHPQLNEVKDSDTIQREERDYNIFKNDDACIFCESKRFGDICNECGSELLEVDQFKICQKCALQGVYSDGNG